MEKEAEGFGCVERYGFLAAAHGRRGSRLKVVIHVTINLRFLRLEKN